MRLLLLLFLWGTVILYIMRTIYVDGGLHVEGKQILFLALAALMMLSLLAVPTAAVSPTDMINH